MISIIFHRGAEIPSGHFDPEGEGKLVRTMRLAGLDEVEAARGYLTAVIRAWCKAKSGR